MIPTTGTHMTIFDSIRYPISDVPTLEELSRLPMELLTELSNQMFDDGRVRTPGGLSVTFQLGLTLSMTQSSMKEMVKLLRKMIAELE